MKNLKGKNAKQITKTFRDADINDTVNWKHERGSVYMAGGILSKLKDGEQSIAIDGKWVKV